MRNFIKAIAFYIYNGFLTHFPAYAVRHWYLKRILKIRIGSETAIHCACHFAGNHVIIGNGSVINRECYLDGRAGIEIGDRVSISPHCYLLSLTHDPQSPDFGVIARPLKIGSYSWLGARAIILPGAHIGTGSVVGAGSVVSKPTADYDIVAGNPARPIGTRNRNLTYQPQYFPWFNTDITP